MFSSCYQAQQLEHSLISPSPLYTVCAPYLYSPAASAKPWRCTPVLASFTLLLWISGLHILGIFNVISAAELFLSKFPLSCILLWLYSQTVWLAAVCTWAWVGSSSPPRLHSISPSDFTYHVASQETRYITVSEIKGAGCDIESRPALESQICGYLISNHVSCRLSSLHKVHIT